MSVVIVVSLNFIFTILNLIILWQLIKLKTYLTQFNQSLPSIEANLTLLLKQIPLILLLTALEMQKYKKDYRQWRSNLQKVSQIITVSKYVYKIYHN